MDSPHARQACQEKEAVELAKGRLREEMMQILLWVEVVGAMGWVRVIGASNSGVSRYRSDTLKSNKVVSKLALQQ